jgi:chromosome segregation ATPase
MTQASENSPVRLDKTIDWLNKSRDKWKDKTQMTKAQLKVAKQAQARARESRQEWRAKYEELEQQQSMLLEEKSKEIILLKTKVQELEHENGDLKKKYLLRLMTQN